MPMMASEGRTVLEILIAGRMSSKSTALPFVSEQTAKPIVCFFLAFFVSPLLGDYLSLSPEVFVHFVTTLVAETILVSQW